MENGNYWSETQDRASSVAEGPGLERGDPAAIGRYRVVRRLGQGGFGRVYLARDEDLDRAVAIKVPNPERVSGPGDVEAYLAEARALAKLDHPHIVPVYDVGRTADGLCFVVSKYIDGSDLAGRIGQGRPSARESAELVATVAEALHHAHTRGLVHRDIKPANILIDAGRSPWVADFGLALKDEDYGKGARLAGTPAYMSPEQARGEGHRVDGRSDIFSLGVVLYELLTGRKPFRGDSRAEVMDQIATSDPRPPRQIDDTIARELERICLKALSKRASERYSTGRDMAEDLRHFVQTETASGPAPAPPSGATSAAGTTGSTTAPGSTREATPTPPVAVPSDSDGRAVKIVPKGLRSFDRHDASFFLELLPGPRDRDGLPEGLRFWKTRIESTDPDATFKVGLIYGPSGCGKSSMVKAGLLPRLHPDVMPVYVEATPEETEARLLRGLRKVCPELDGGLDLVESLAALRRGRVLRPGQKVVLVLDQFEQWLFARRAEADPELVAALRQCDGDHVQAVVMVRDDFWMAATRFMRDLEVRIVEGENSAAVDLFDPMHARRVLAAFGRAYGVLPEKPSEMTADQKAFLEQSVDGLANEGKVISVRLALFAEMVKGKPWTTATLRDVGGARGIGVAFLDETFSASTAPPEHRLHQRAAQAVLKALLPGTGADIKGQMRSEAELREASGYAARPRDFEDAMCILDRELRLITPTDPEGSVNDSQSGDGGGRRFYQLTHDYLVPSLREWLTRKQRETRRGRAEIRLAERAAIWEARPESRHLPSVSEWVNIRALTRPKGWTEPQRKMMRRAGRAHGLRAIAAAIGIVGLAFAGLEVWGRIAAARKDAAAAEQKVRRAAAEAVLARVQNLLKASTAEIPSLLREIAGDPMAERKLRDVIADPLVNDQARLRASLALLPVDPGQADSLVQSLFKATPDEAAVITDRLGDHRADLKPKLWPELESARLGEARLLPVAGALALYDPDNPLWADHAGKVAQALVTSAPESLPAWLALLSPVRRHLIGPLASIFRKKESPEAEHDLATRSLVDFTRDDPALLTDLLLDADPKAYASLFPVAEKQPEKVAAILRDELARKPVPSWRDPTADPSWTGPDPALREAIESARGLIDDDRRFAFCQTMPMADFDRLAEGLQKSGYRPVRLRPYADGKAVRVAAVWTRDGRDWRKAVGLSAGEMKQRDERYGREKWIPIDVAGYVVTGEDGKPADRYAALWVRAAGDDDARMSVGATAEEEPAIREDFADRDWVPRTLQVLHLADGRPRISGVWGRPAPDGAAGTSERELDEGGLADARARRSDAMIVDISVDESGRSRPWRERVREMRDLAEIILRLKPGNLDATWSRARASLRLGESAKALEDLNSLIGTGRADADILLDRAIALARLGRNEEAAEALARFQQSYAPDDSKLAAAVTVAAELGEASEGPIRALDSAMKQRPDDIDLRREAARAFAAASGPVAGRDQAAGLALAERALRLLEDLVRDDSSELEKMKDDRALDPLRDDPRFVALAKQRHPGRRYAAVWAGDPGFKYEAIAGVAPADQLERARSLMKDGYRPVAWSAARAEAGESPATASIWRRPVVSEEQKDRLAERQARAAVALIRFGKGEGIWPLLQHSHDPRLRSFLINGLKPMGADPRSVADAFRRIEDSSRRGPSRSGTRDILFDPDTSIRRALILALGTYLPDGLPASDRPAIVSTLKELYRSDPDAGIHAAAEWTLRRWKEKLEPLDPDRSAPDDRGSRRWFVDLHGQAFAVIDGPVDFRMGSPGTEPGRDARYEAPRRIIIPRRFAIATKEVTVQQFQEFLKTNDQFRVPRSYLNQYTSIPDGPWIAPTWYAAAAYCNWLSERENLPRSQWCYLPNESGAYTEGMRIPADVLERTGYRLPTLAEWEYACRAGAVTSRYYGLSTGLLGAYAWYAANSEDHAWPGGRRLPNDLGLFDMLGNVSEWCLDRHAALRPTRKGLVIDITNAAEIVVNKETRIFKGGTAYDQPSDLRSALRPAEAPTFESTACGFRLARTLKPAR